MLLAMLCSPPTMAGESCGEEEQAGFGETT